MELIRVARAISEMRSCCDELITEVNEQKKEINQLKNQNQELETKLSIARKTINDLSDNSIYTVDRVKECLEKEDIEEIDWEDILHFKLCNGFLIPYSQSKNLEMKKPIFSITIDFNIFDYSFKED